MPAEPERLTYVLTIDCDHLGERTANAAYILTLKVSYDCRPLCVAVLGTPHVICDHAAAAAPVAGCICTPVASAVQITVIRRIRGVHATGTVEPAMSRVWANHGQR